MIATFAASTLRLAQSTTAVRYTNPLAIGIYVVSNAHTWLARLMVSPRSKSGYMSWPGCFVLVPGFR